MNANDIKNLRIKMGLTQQGLAFKLRVYASTVYEWEKGSKPSPKNLRDLERLAKRAGGSATRGS